ncbi:Heat shock protein DnaJ with tetratricopeptide repeat isoform 1 [Hibiscus syriacus]|uniref:Heat shock protein DnaJ with tetratricopeptide repeat isoform 1 n=1 Tax=Hibiscus syriacus TaxID=106335 RepID=A0A6A2X3C9_HIBSY|nr:BRCT domain-containing protein At4g02110-like [Hibiscus syriacus]KAE8669483.1 Heat shock protein DnaJ with tetratricopeptide repeat isoform 1 [Hibiscus syriacus]
MLESDTPSKTFLGVRFCLYGFDPVNEREIREKLITGGGVGVGQYSRNCTHLIVDKIVYDDPVCVAALNDGKTVVTGLWVDHSSDVGMPVDATSVMYRPLRDLNGIPGAESLIVCLTGYQKQDRDDIMTMVSLMGAQFSKPLVASKITHLICYKFEGEKYELAKKIKKIKLINHRWLEDCLREWEILSEANYSKSGYELEMMEAEAKDSDEEAEETTLKHYGQQSMNRSPQDMRAGMLSSRELLPAVEVSTSTMPKRSPNTKEVLVTPGKSPPGPSVNNASSTKVAQPGNRSHNSTNMGNYLESTSKSSLLSNQIFTGISYSRKTSSKSSGTSTLPNLSREESGNNSDYPQAMKIKDVSDVSSSKMQQPEERTGSCFDRSPWKGGDLCHDKDSAGMLPLKRALDLSGSSSKSQKMSNAKASVKGSALDTEQWELRSLGDQPQINDYSVNETGFLNSLHSSCAGKATAKLSTDLCSSITLIPEDRQKSRDKKSPGMSFGGYTVSTFAGKPDMQNEIAYEKSPQISFTGLREPTPASRSNIEDNSQEQAQVGGEPGELQNKQQVVEVPSFDDRKLQNENSHIPSNLDVLQGGNDKSVTKPVSKKLAKLTKPVNKPDMQSENACEKSPQMSFKGLRLTSSASRSNIKECSLEQLQVAGEHDGLKNKQQDVEVPSLDERKPGNEGSHSPSYLNVLEGGNDKSVIKPVTKKLKKKTLGSRPKLSNIADRKGSIYSSNIYSENHSTISLDAESKRATHKSASEHEICPPTMNLDSAKDVKKVAKCQNSATSKTQFIDDETQAPDEEDDNDPRTAEKEKSERVELMFKADTFVEVEHVNHDSNVAQDGTPIASENRTNGTDPEKEGGSKNSEFGEPILKFGGLKKKANKRRKQLAGRAMMKADPSNSTNNLVGENSSVMKNVEEKENEKENFMLHSASKPKSSATSSKVEISGAADKSSPVCHVEVSGKSIGKLSNKTVKTNRQPLQKVSDRMKNEPLCFILCGHRLQRKEFQQVIRRLKGKFCRDSHQWSYQATHFIALDPVRRTEKFFGAAASGRWILKSDYLSACNQAGRFLAEEPYEWHKNGLSEDGAINLEAPRKWRQLRERTGHGAFYGMRIIVYGECIAPPLDTLKRVVKAGDGDILATSPPYTRFLKSGVDFAVVSPGMPHVDMWVQEFLKHEVPCVVADYLVEYVCKPGYSLERHVLYNTLEWAEKSFSNLTSRAKEIIEDSTPDESPNDSEGNDVTCQVCGSGDREEVMLICGDEKGSVGCGVGTHIDCCDPPLDAIPAEDWFCPKCSTSSINNTSSSKKRKKGASRSKGR